MSLQNITLPYQNSQGGEAAVGSILSVAPPGSPTVFYPLGNAGNLDWPLSLKEADVTNQGTNWTRSIGTVYDGGKFTCELNFIPSSVNAVVSGQTIEGHSFLTGIGSLFNGDPYGGTAPICQWRLQFPDGITWYFAGFVMDFPIGMDQTKALLVKMTIRVVGQPVFA